MSNTYTFTLQSFRITDTRSLHEDTDYVTIAVAVDNSSPITLPTKAMGDLNNGTFKVNMSIPKVTVPPTSKVAFTYSIVNSGYDKNTIEQALQKAVSAGAGVTATEMGGGSFITDALSKVTGIIFADCDGVVAQGKHVFTGADLAAKTAGG